MARIIEKQRIAKRRKPSSSKSSNKSAGFNAGFMNQFNQKRVPTRKKVPISLFAKLALGANLADKTDGAINWAKGKKFQKSKGSGFSFPIPSIATMAVVAGVIVLAMAALNFEGFNISVPDIYAIVPTEDTEVVEERISKYAATGISGIFGARNETPAATTGAATPENQGSPGSTEAAAVNTVNDNHHGMLVTFEWQKYKVQKNDSVSGIAQKHGVSVGAIIASNEIRNARRLQEGTVLRIPNIDGIPYQIQKGDNLSRISASFNVPLEVILDVNDIKSDNIKPGETLFIPGARMNDIDLRLSLGDLFAYPLQSRHVTSRYGMRKDPISGALQFHAGVDFRANTGAPVMAALDGTISVVGENWLYGKYIIMTHGNGYKTLYGHLNSYSVKQGDRVARGRKIGEVGNTGYSTGPHLHFGIYDKNNKLVNPLDLLN